MRKYFTLLVLTLGIQFSGISQVVINEYSASNLNSFYDSFSKTEDWIEFYNASSTMADLSGWHLSDKEDEPGKWKFPAGTVIEPGGFLTVYCSGRDAVFSGEYHTNFKLAQTTGKDMLLFSDENENIVESHELSITLVEHSNCRNTDGGDEWLVY